MPDYDAPFGTDHGWPDPQGPMCGIFPRSQNDDDSSEIDTGGDDKPAVSDDAKMMSAKEMAERVMGVPVAEAEQLLKLWEIAIRMDEMLDQHKRTLKIIGGEKP